MSLGGVAAAGVAGVAGSSGVVTGPRLAPGDDGGIGFLSASVVCSMLAGATLPRSPQQTSVPRRTARIQPVRYAMLGYMPDPFDLQRFVKAQAPVYDTVLAELRAGRKRSHWIWFVFPQLTGLGSSLIAMRYAIESRAEAEAYLRHQLLGPRLHECARTVTAVDGRSIEEIFGWPDYLKVRSSMTLFARSTDDNADFVAVLDKYYGGEEDPVTVEKLS